MLLNGMMLKGLNEHLKLVSDYRSLEKIHRWIFRVKFVCGKIFLSLGVSNEYITFLFIVKNVLFIQFSSCNTSNKNFLASNFSQTYTHRGIHSARACTVSKFYNKKLILRETHVIQCDPIKAREVRWQCGLFNTGIIHKYTRI